MKRATTKRPRRIPRTSEEVKEFIALRKRKESVALAAFKRTHLFKALNSWNVFCIFIYLEIIFCYLGPCHYQKHFTSNVGSRMGNEYKPNGKAIVSEIDLYALDGNTYNVIVNDFMMVPSKLTSFKIGKDFVMQKKLKVVLSESNHSYRLFMASPVLLLCCFLSFIVYVAYHFNLNENFYSLIGICSLNALTLFAISLY